MSKSAFCCAMRERFLVGIVAENAAVPNPSDLVDFLDFEAKSEVGKPIIRTRFCSFCGARIAADPLRVFDPPREGDEWKGD